MRRILQLLQLNRYTERARHFSEGVSDPSEDPIVESGALASYFENHTEGHGIWKWDQYFPVYERHFAKYVGRPVNVLEIGIYAGGSLPMWRTYFGQGCHVYGVDIEPACKTYESDDVTVFIGDQGDRNFWRDLNLPPIDIVIDDGGHLPEQMVVTFEETFNMVSAESVYLCEDIHGTENPFISYVYGLTQSLNAANYVTGEGLAIGATRWQRRVSGIHSYPFAVVVERTVRPARLNASKKGTEWQPF